MKKFDINQIRSGTEVQTRDGRTAKVIYTKRDNEKFPIVAIIEEKQVHYFTIDGMFYEDKTSPNDLFLP